MRVLYSRRYYTINVNAYNNSANIKYTLQHLLTEIDSYHIYAQLILITL